MGQCCSNTGQETKSANSNDLPLSSRLSLDIFSNDKNKNKLKKVKKDKSEHKHHPLPDHQSSGSQQTTPNNDEPVEFLNDYAPNTSNRKKKEDISTNQESIEESIDLSRFHEEVIEFIEFWHSHFEIISKDSIHQFLVTRIHSKVRGMFLMHYAHFRINIVYIFVVFCVDRTIRPIPSRRRG